jgi:hypothetical protein
MPAATSARAPSFSGEKEDLLDFLEAFEDLADENGLTDEQKCKYIVRYVSTRTKRWWTLLPGYAKRDFPSSNRLFSLSIQEQRKVCTTRSETWKGS